MPAAGRRALSADPSFAEMPKPCANISRFWDEFGGPKRCIWRWHVRRCAIFPRAIAGFFKKCWVFEELSSPAERAAGEWHREILWVDETNRPCRSARAEQVPQLFLLRFQIIFSVRIGRDFTRNALRHLDPGFLEGGHLIRIIR